MKNRHQLIYILILFGFMFISFIIYKLNNHIKDNQVLYETMITKEAISNFKNILATRQWNSNHGGVFVKQVEGLQPNPYLKNNTLLAKDGSVLIKVNPAWMTREIMRIGNETNKNYFRITSLNPINPENKADKFEHEALTYLEKNPEKPYYTKLSQNNSMFHFMGPLKVTETCITCHKEYKIGDLRGGIRISLPTNDYFTYLDKIKKENIILIFIIITIASSLAIISLWFTRRISKHQETIEQHYNRILHLKKENEIVFSRYEYAVQGTQDGIWDWDLLTDQVYFSKNWKSMLGYEEHEIPSDLEEWDKRVHPDDKEQALKDITENQKGTTSHYKNIHRMQHKNGSWVWILDRGKTYFDKTGKAIRMVGFHTNITETKNLEIKLYENQYNLEVALKVANMGYWKYNLSSDEFYLSDSLCELLGIENKKDINSYKELQNLIFDDDLERVNTSHLHLLTHKINSQLIYKIKNSITQKYLTIEENIAYLENDVNNDELIVATIKDITDKTNLEEELKRLQTVIESAPISIVITDINANIIYVNPNFCNITGYSKDEIIGKNPRILKYGTADNQEFYNNLWKTISNKKTWGGIFRNRKKDASEYWETATILPILDKDENIVNYMGIMREITEEVYLKKALDEKEELMLMQSKNAAMGEMISMIAHQWRQPITAISMSANNIIADIDLDMLDKEETRETAQNIAQQTQFLSKTIDDFRNFFKKDKNQETTTFKTIFNEIFSIILASLKNNSVDIKLNYDEELTISTYKQELIQVLLNIIKNAKEAFDGKKIEQKQIDVLIKEQEDKIYITISDNAGGIPKENLEKLFEAYFTTKEEFNGTGLGLYMSKIIIEKHLKGSLTVENNAKGATFKIVLHKIIK